MLILVLVFVLSATLGAETPARAQEFDPCSLFSTDAAAHLLGEPVVNTSGQVTDASNWTCSQDATDGHAGVELHHFASAQEANAPVAGGSGIPGLGDASSLVRQEEGNLLVLNVRQGPWVVYILIDGGSRPVAEVTNDELAPLAQAVLDSLPPTPQPVLDASPPAAEVVLPANGGRTPASMDPCSVVNDEDVRAALAAVANPGASVTTVAISHSRVPLIEENPSDAGASSEACKVVWGSNSTLVVLVTREWYDFMATFGGKPTDGLGGDAAIVVDEVPCVRKGDIAVLAETGGNGGTLRLHREIVKRAAARL